ncbi:MAG: hypothetical protein HQK83_16775 [Fibrobacteria bacterium]|nr:hypothetical protein [Fibrobacteria bacterium]
MKLMQFVFVGLLTVALPAMAQYKAGDVTNGGSISGIVKKKGSIPKDTMAVVNADMEFCGKELPAEEYVISKAGEIQNAVAMLDGIKSGAAWTTKEAFMDNVKCRNEPRVVVAPKGGTMKYKNSDPIGHTAHYYLMEKGGKKKDLLNQAMPNKDMVMTTKKPLRKPGVIFVGCDPHTFEAGYVIVSEHPYANVTNAKGAFKLENVPAGKHKLKVWHEKLGEKTVDVEVKAGADTKVTVEF